MAYRSKRKQQLRDENLLADLTAGGLTLRELANKYAMTLEQLGKWVRSENICASLSSLCTLADFQTQLILSQHRVSAAATLMNIAGSEAGTEMKRKACVDALRLNMPRIESRTESQTKEQKHKGGLKQLPFAVMREEFYREKKADEEQAGEEKADEEKAEEEKDDEESQMNE